MRITIRVKPGAKRARVGGSHPLPQVSARQSTPKSTRQPDQRSERCPDQGSGQLSGVAGQRSGRHGMPGEPAAALVVAVTAPAVDGRATTAALRAVAAAFDVPVRDVTMISGARSRDKIIDIGHSTPDIERRLTDLLAD